MTLRAASTLLLSAPRLNLSAISHSGNERCIVSVTEVALGGCHTANLLNGRRKKVFGATVKRSKALPFR